MPSFKILLSCRIGQAHIALSDVAESSFIPNHELDRLEVSVLLSNSLFPYVSDVLNLSLAQSFEVQSLNIIIYCSFSYV